MKEEHREEFIEVFDEIAEMASNTLKNDNVVPASITLNREHVGIKIRFYKLDKIVDDEEV